MTKFITVRGKSYWARVFEENKDLTGYNDELTESGGQYTINVDLDAESLRKLTEAKSQVPDYPRAMEGETVYRIKRFHEKRDKAGEVLPWASGRPKVTHVDGTPWDLEEDGWIGNGSEVELKLCVYKGGRTFGTRLEEVKVIDHVKVEVGGGAD